MNIVVLCGGISSERDVSLSSGSMVHAALKKLGHNSVLIDLFFGYTKPFTDPEEVFTRCDDNYSVTISDTAPDIEEIKKMHDDGGRSHIGPNVIEICSAADIVFMALHGADGEDGKIQAAFDLYGIKYTGTGQLGSTITMNKSVSKTVLLNNGILTPNGITLHRGGNTENTVGYPCVVKPCSGGSSVGTHIVESASEYVEAVEDAFKYDEYVIVEQYIKGREVDVGVIDGIALPPIEICPDGAFYDYRNKYQAGLAAEICPVDFPADVIAKMQKAAVDVYYALHFDVYGRIDFIIDANGEPWCLEGNTLPGMTPTSLLPQEAREDGISYEELCGIIIEKSLKRFEG